MLRRFFEDPPTSGLKDADVDTLNATIRARRKTVGEFHVNFYSFGTRADSLLRVSRRDVFPDPCDQTSIIAPAHPAEAASAAPPAFARWLALVVGYVS